MKKFIKSSNRIDEDIYVKDLDLNVKDWYCETYPDDDLGLEINKFITFDDVITNLNECAEGTTNLDFYDLIQVSDSLIRERVFDKLSEILNVDYKSIYDLWLMG